MISAHLILLPFCYKNLYQDDRLKHLSDTSEAKYFITDTETK